MKWLEWLIRPDPPSTAMMFVQEAVLDRRHNVYIAGIAPDRAHFMAALSEVIQSQPLTQIQLIGEPKEYDGQSVVFLETLIHGTQAQTHRRD